MKRLFGSRAVAAVVVLIGVGVFLVSFARSERLAELDYTATVPANGHIIDVTDNSVGVTYELRQVEFTATAYPVDTSLYQVGDTVKLRVPQERGGLVLIEGTQNSPSIYTTPQIVGGGLALVGLVWLIFPLAKDRGVGTLPPIEYAGQRHGGA